MRQIDYCTALNEALRQEMEADANVVVFGIGVPDHMSIFGSTAGLSEQFGSRRCFDTPLCEDTMTGFAMGAAMCGLRPVHIHIRVDFLLLAMNQLVNLVSAQANGRAEILRGSGCSDLVGKSIVGPVHTRWRVGDRDGGVTRADVVAASFETPDVVVDTVSVTLLC